LRLGPTEPPLPQVPQPAPEFANHAKTQAERGFSSILGGQLDKGRNRQV